MGGRPGQDRGVLDRGGEWWAASCGFPMYFEGGANGICWDQLWIERERGVQDEAEDFGLSKWKNRSTIG